jgi:hypothetical protein
MSNDRGKDDDEVGYCKPPKRTQFKPGQSGNPKGRPKGAKNFSTKVHEVLSLPVKITQGKRQTSVPTDVAVLMRIREKALNGDLRAGERLLAFRMLFSEQSIERTAASSPEDDEILAAFSAEVAASVRSEKSLRRSAKTRGRK